MCEHIQETHNSWKIKSLKKNKLCLFGLIENKRNEQRKEKRKIKRSKILVIVWYTYKLKRNLREKSKKKNNNIKTIKNKKNLCQIFYDVLQ